MSTDHDFRTEHEHVGPLLAEHALGTADPHERSRIDTHLAQCAACLTTFSELTDAVSGLEQAVHAPALDPRAGAREKLLVAARATSQVAGTGDTVPSGAQTPRPRIWRTPSWLPLCSE